MARWFVLDINPEPWKVGPLSVGRNKAGKLFPIVGRDQQLSSFQSAVKELLGEDHEKFSGKVQVTLYFWRQQADYSGTTKRVRKHYVDTTNMQKATEDALQGIFFTNDSVVADIRSVTVEQGPDVDPRIVIKIEDWVALDPNEIPDTVWSEIDHQPDLLGSRVDDNSWGPEQQL